MAAVKQHNDGRKVVAENRKARHDYHVIETMEAGISLVGTEVKSLRGGTCTISDAYVRVDGGEAWLIGMHIPPYLQGNIHNHDPERTRKLLLHRKEIDKLDDHVRRKGSTLVPLSIYFARGRAKVGIGIAKGKQARDKRHAIAERDTKRQLEREMKLRMQ